MKLLTLNFLTCAVKRCKQSATATATATAPSPPQRTTDPQSRQQQTQETGFPLHVRDATLSIVELDFNPLFLRNVIPRIEWGAMRKIVEEVGLRLPEGVEGAGGEEEVGMDVDDSGGGGGGDDGDGKEEKRLRALHRVLLETQVESGMLVCGLCGHEYAVLEGIPNFLLPPHLV